jgi:hypothetical protein
MADCSRVVGPCGDRADDGGPRVAVAVRVLEVEPRLRQLLQVVEHAVGDRVELALAVGHEVRAQVGRVRHELLEVGLVHRPVAGEVDEDVRLARPVVADRHAAGQVRPAVQVLLRLGPEIELVAQPQVVVLLRRHRDVADVVLPHPAPDQLAYVRLVGAEAELRALAHVVLDLRLFAFSLRRRGELPVAERLARGGRRDRERQRDEAGGDERGAHGAHPTAQRD